MALESLIAGVYLACLDGQSAGRTPEVLPPIMEVFVKALAIHDPNPICPLR